MGSTFYAMREGKLVEIYRTTSEVDAPAVHQDTFKNALKHPKTGEMVDSMTRWNAINKEHGLRVVGNDLMSEAKDGRREVVTEERVLDAIERAEAICSDMTKFRAKQNENFQLMERNERLLKYANR